MEISWKRNFYILWAAQLIAIIGFQAIQPFLAYYIQEFDVADLDEALIWAGKMGTAAGLSMAVASPIWGSLADRFGRKAMVVRAMLGGGVAVALMAYVSSLEQLLAVRMLQGALSGTVAACITLVSTTTPRQHLGYALGMMQGAVMLGASLGPLVGSLLIGGFGYDICFIASGVLVSTSALCVRVWVKEDFRRTEQHAGGDERAPRPTGVLSQSLRMLRLRPFLIMLVSLSLIQFAFGVTMPVLPLFLQQLAGHDDVLALAGKIFSAAGLIGAASSALLGRWSDRLGAKRVLLWGLLSYAVFLFAQGFAHSVGMLAAFMVLAGVSGGAIRPVANTLVARIVAEEDRGMAFGVLTSANAFGWALGPMAGGYLGANLGFRQVFFITGALFLGVALWVRITMGRIAVDEAEPGHLRQLLAQRWRRRERRA